MQEGREREWMMMKQFTPIMYWRGPELQEAGGKGKFVCSQRCTASKNNEDCRLAWQGTSHRRLCLVGDTASQCSTVSTCFTLVPLGLVVSNSTAAHLFLQRDHWLFF